MKIGEKTKQTMRNSLDMSLIGYNVAKTWQFHGIEFKMFP